MLEEGLKYRLMELNPEDFIVIPSLNVAVSKFKTRTADGKLLKLNWYETKQLVQSLGSNYFLPTSAQWSKYLGLNSPEIVKDFITGDPEWVDSLLAFPNKNGEYSSRLQIPEIKKGKVPLLIEQSKIEKDGNNYVLTEGKVTEIPELPLKIGYIQEYNDELGLPIQVGDDPNKRFEGAYFLVNPYYEYDEGLRAIIRGSWMHGRVYRDSQPGRFETIVGYSPSFSGVCFRLCRIPTNRDFVRVSWSIYKELSRLIERLNNLMLKIES